MAITDAGMLINVAMKATKSTGVPVSHGHVTGDKLTDAGRERDRAAPGHCRRT